MSEFLVFFLFGAVIVGLIVWQFVAMHRRHQALAAHCAARGWSIAKKSKRHQELEAWRGFDIGHSRYTRNHIVDGQREWFTYRYTTGSGKNSQTHVRRVHLAPAPIAAPAPLLVEREHIGHRIIDAFGEKDIDIELEDFSRRYRILCADRAFAYSVFTPTFATWYDGTKAVLQWRDDRMMLMESGPLRVEDLASLAGHADEITNRLPRHLVVG